MRLSVLKYLITTSILALAVTVVTGQDVTRTVELGGIRSVDIVNNYGRVGVMANRPAEGDDARSTLEIRSSAEVASSEIKIVVSSGRAQITVAPAGAQKRIDLILSVPERSSVKITTSAGAVDIIGDPAMAEVVTDTGTIAANIPDGEIGLKLTWTESRPRYMADMELPEVKEKRAGRFEIKGSVRVKGMTTSGAGSSPESTGSDADSGTKAAIVPRQISLDLTTARGIILLNVPPNEVGSDLRERPLTRAAKAIVSSGDSLLMEAIRRAAPRYYGDYLRSLPPIKREPVLGTRPDTIDLPNSRIKSALVRVTDTRNRAIAGLGPADFEMIESGTHREVISVEAATAPFNLVLLLDVSGSVENYVTFIRKAARSFVNTVDQNDKISIVIFNDDVSVLSGFTTDKTQLSASLDSFDAGGGTAYYDALAYAVADTLRPLRGERTAIVILTDGDDNRSFLAFDSLLGSIQESGALIYPLYVPSELIAAESGSQYRDIDPLRKRYMTLSAKSEGEGDRLARVSGGVYYPISQISQIQQAYEDIVRQLRTAYVVTYRSAIEDGRSPKLRVRVKRENAYATVNSVRAADSDGTLPDQ